MFLFILENGEIIKSEEFDSVDLEECREGCLEIIDITNPKYPLKYGVLGQWKELENC